MDAHEANRPVTDAAAPTPEKPGWIRSLRTGAATGIALVAFGFAILTYAAYYSYQYWTGTPTTATVGRCHSDALVREAGESTGTYCDGTWSIDGQSRSGPISPQFTGGDGDNHERPGSKMDVHVKGDRAFWLTKKDFYGLIGGPILMVVGSVNIWRRRRRQSRA